MRLATAAGLMLVITGAFAAPALAQHDAPEWRIGAGYSFMHDSGSGVSFPLGAYGQVERTIQQRGNMRIAIDGEGAFYHASVGVAFQFVQLGGTLGGARTNGAFMGTSTSVNLVRVSGGVSVHLSEDKKDAIHPYAGVQGGVLTGGGSTGVGFAIGGGVEYQWKPNLDLRVGVDFGFFHVPAGWTKELAVNAGIMIPLGK